MTDAICAIPDCTQATYRAGYCGGHYMRKWRYGDPLHVPTRGPYARVKAYWYNDITGQRFGMLSVIERVGNRWRCVCDCGDETVVRIGDLNRGTAQSCGKRSHRRRDQIRYTAAHQRVRHDRGPASQHSCIDCGRRARQWSYGHADPNELIQDGMAYSLDSSYCDPRCVPCHKTFDLDYIARVA